MMTMTAEPTNREKLLDELSKLSNDALYLAFADNRITRATMTPCVSTARPSTGAAFPPTITRPARLRWTTGWTRPTPAGGSCRRHDGADRAADPDYPVGDGPHFEPVEGGDHMK